MSSLLPNNDPGVNVVVSKEEYNLFHNIDRQLFYRFTAGLGRDPSQTTHVMAFIIWLEKFTRDFRMVAYLLQWPNSLLADLADEAVLVLNCIESPQFPYHHVGSNNYEGLLPLIQKITRSSVNLMYFHQKRIDIIPGITRILNDVCTRAFNDIVLQVNYQRAMKDQHSFNAVPAAIPQFYGQTPQPQPRSSFVQPMFYYTPVVHEGVALVPQQPMMVPQQQWHEGSSSGASWVPPGAGVGGSGSVLGPYQVINKDDFNQEFQEILASLKISDDVERKEVLAPDDRTVFMTFSKGYPISENEVKEFFSRRYGDVIESIFMQEVPEHEQPLYARLVVRPGAINMIDGLLDGTSRMKFVINGKHVWARRYLRKGNKSPQTSSYDSPFGAGPSH
ncbi:unnamed protein product [Lupinus luteus]|uniref:RRM domain-containing protein n=1 Tax=Lupinus luteus TaxID=3873 RepID=A0AAV1YJ72_LUPLU